jgi:hypothetical protein
MLPHPDRYDENAFRPSGWATQYWMRFFAMLRMTAKDGAAMGPRGKLHVSATTLLTAFQPAKRRFR